MARVAVGVLTAAEVPEGSSFRVIGEVLTVKEIVAALARGLGRDVVYRDVPDAAWAEAARTRLNPHAVAHLSKLWANFREPGPTLVEFAVTDTIQDLGGRAPKRFEEFVIEQQAGFAA